MFFSHYLPGLTVYLMAEHPRELRDVALREVRRQRMADMEVVVVVVMEQSLERVVKAGSQSSGNMNLSAFLDVKMDDPLLVGLFMSENANTHRDIQTAIMRTGVIVPAYPLADSSFTADFFNVHHEEHKAWGSALGITLPMGLENADPEDEQSMNDWLILHAQATQDVAAALGL